MTTNEMKSYCLSYQRATSSSLWQQFNQADAIGADAVKDTFHAALEHVEHSGNADGGLWVLVCVLYYRQWREACRRASRRVHHLSVCRRMMSDTFHAAARILSPQDFELLAGLKAFNWSDINTNINN